CNSGYLASDNNGRWTLYTINDKRKVDTSGRKVATSKSKVDTSKSKVDTSKSKVDTSKSKVDTSHAKASRMKKEELERLILLICKDNYMKMDEVASMTNRSFDYLKNKIFPTLVKDGKLIKKFPYTINHPQQAYKTTDEYAEQL
ncbi:MAG: AAA family ATPase, partial [Dysgonamonadaceae bacterium]|nr:AAA family ATPase [Dysgonamonadaceae bacterium]